MPKLSILFGKKAFQKVCTQVGISIPQTLQSCNFHEYNFEFPWPIPSRDQIRGLQKNQSYFQISQKYQYNGIKIYLSWLGFSFSRTEGFLSYQRKLLCQYIRSSTKLFYFEDFFPKGTHCTAPPGAPLPRRRSSRRRQMKSTRHSGGPLPRFSQTFPSLRTDTVTQLAAAGQTCMCETE